jgi:hypothetical protein
MRRGEWEPPAPPGHESPGRSPEWESPPSEPDQAPGIHDPPAPGSPPGNPGIIA